MQREPPADLENPASALVFLATLILCGGFRNRRGAAHCFQRMGSGFVERLQSAVARVSRLPLD